MVFTILNFCIVSFNIRNKNPSEINKEIGEMDSFVFSKSVLEIHKTFWKLDETETEKNGL